jgi:diguanylate cyclase (GGDEF)-like protein
MLDSPDILLSKPTQHPNQVKQYMSKGLTEPDARDALTTDLNLVRARRDASANNLRAEKYKDQSLIDPLTQLYNRRHLDGDGSDTALGIGELRRKFDEALRAKHDLSILMIDVDDFRNYNNTYGHPEGDMALKTIADTIRKRIRDVDIPFRYGGEEILILLPEANIFTARAVAERLRDAIEKIQTLNGQVTVSIGASTFHNSKEWKNRTFNQNPETKDKLLQLADDALYFSKKERKNKVSTGNNLTEEQILERHSQKDKSL